MDELLELDGIANNMADKELLDMIMATDFGETNQTDVVEVEEGVRKGCTCGDKANIMSDYSNGVIVCTNCGTVIDGVLDDTAEWRNYNGQERAVERCLIATNPHMPWSSLGTSIAGKYRNRVMTLNDWGSMIYTERNLNNEFKSIIKSCEKMKLLKCISDDAKIMYKYIYTAKYRSGIRKGDKIIFRANNKEGLKQACIFFACLRKGEPRSIYEMAEISGLEYSNITDGLKNFFSIMRMYDQDIKINFRMKSSLPEHFVSRYAKRLKLDPMYAKIANQIAKNARKLNIASSHTPISVAIGCIWMVIEMNSLPYTKKSLSVEFTTSEVTICKTRLLLKPKYHILIDDEKTNEVIEKVKQKKKILTLPLELQERYMEIVGHVRNDISQYKHHFKFDESDTHNQFNKLTNKWNKLIK